MGRIHIVTDSCARFEHKHFARDYDVTIVPFKVTIGGKTYLDGVDIEAEDLIQRIQLSGEVPAVQSPTVDDYEQVYAQLSKETDRICVITSAQGLSKSYENAQSARAGYMGRCDIIVIDSRNSSAGQGYLTEDIAIATDSNNSLDDVVRIARSLVPRIYAVYYVDSLEYIQRVGLLNKSQSIVGGMLDIKPLLTVEDGRLITMEKARTHTAAIDKMMEFVSEFTEIEKLAILQGTHRITERTRMLQDRLALEFSKMTYPVLVYEPLITSYLGPDAMGMVVLEGNLQ